MVTGVAGAMGVVERREAGRLVERLTAQLRAWTGSGSRPTPALMLELWRDAERDLAAAPLGTTAWDEAHARCDTARSAYQRLFQLTAADCSDLRHAGVAQLTRD